MGSVFIIDRSGRILGAVDPMLIHPIPPPEHGVSVCIATVSNSTHTGRWRTPVPVRPPWPIMFELRWHKVHADWYALMTWDQVPVEAWVQTGFTDLRRSFIAC